METFSALLAICAGNSPVPGEFPAQRPVTRSFDVFFDLCPNKQLSKQLWGWWFETPSWSSWRHCNDSWLVISDVLWLSFEGSLTGMLRIQILDTCLKMISLNYSRIYHRPISWNVLILRSYMHNIQFKTYHVYELPNRASISWPWICVPSMKPFMFLFQDRRVHLDRSIMYIAVKLYRKP